LATSSRRLRVSPTICAQHWHAGDQRYPAGTRCRSRNRRTRARVCRRRSSGVGEILSARRSLATDSSSPTILILPVPVTSDDFRAPKPAKAQLTHTAAYREQDNASRPEGPPAWDTRRNFYVPGPALAARALPRMKPRPSDRGAVTIAPTVEGSFLRPALRGPMLRFRGRPAAIVSCVRQRPRLFRRHWRCSALR
jgi:hypothetical protein